MSKLSKIILLAVAITVLSWFLPWLYALLTPSPSADPFCSFSPVVSKWVASKSVPGQKPLITVVDAFPSDETPDTINASRRDILVPQMYYRQLMAHEQMPDSINGKEASVHNLRTHEVFYNGSPRDINKNTAGIWLMMESMPVRVDLSDPEEGFRMTKDGIEFISMADNKVNSSRSARFTQAMKSRGFKFPASDLSANINSRKAYDEGYLMVDAEGKAFHVKQQGGRPYVAALTFPEGVKVAKVIIWEEADQSLLGMAVDTENNPYIIRKEGHIAMPLPGDNCKVDPRKDAITAIGSLFNITMRFSGADGTRWRAFDADSLELIGALDFPKNPSTASSVARWIFPFTFALTSNYDSLAYPRIANISWKALPLNIVLAGLLLFLGIRRRNATMKWGALVTLPLGIFAFIPFLLLHD